MKAESAAKDIAVADTKQGVEVAKAFVEDTKTELNVANEANAEVAKKELDTVKAYLATTALEAENAKLKEELSNIDKGDEEINATIDEIIVSLEALTAKIDAL